MKRLIPLLLISVLLTACGGPEPLPPTEYGSLNEARRILAERQDEIDTVEAECDVTITNAEGRSTTLDGAVVLAGGDRVRFKTWKFTQGVFDLTVNPDGRFLSTSDRLKEKAPDAEQGLARLSEHLGGMLRGPDFGQALIREVRDPAEVPWVDQVLPDRSAEPFIEARWASVAAVVDRQTLTPLAYYLEGDQTLKIQTTFGLYDGRYWLDVLTAEGSFGRLEMRFKGVTINGELNSRAFTPPRRARSL